MNEISLKLSNPQTIKEIQRSNPEMENKSFEEIKRDVLAKTKMVYNAQFTMLVSMLSLLLYATLNSIVISVIFRRIVFRN